MIGRFVCRLRHPPVRRRRSETRRGAFWHLRRPSVCTRDNRSRECFVLRATFRDSGTARGQNASSVHLAWILSLSRGHLSRTEMTYLSSWEEFERGAERLYLQDPMNVCFEISYSYLSLLAPFISSILDSNENRPIGLFTRMQFEITITHAGRACSYYANYQWWHDSLSQW